MIKLSSYEELKAEIAENMRTYKVRAAKRKAEQTTLNRLEKSLLMLGIPLYNPDGSLRIYEEE